ncbi:fatty-acid amide hydrolase 2 isoform X2 [Anoplophora glabripennis]|nr:fatty-acid amide hydrolase 2 isoform X2 [Anoplophora glabripennis]
MSAGVATIRMVMWMAFKSLNILYIPIFIARKFKRSKICPPVKDEILLLPASELADKIRKQELSSEAVVKAYITRIEEVNPLINAVIEDRFKQAIEDAKYADKLISFGTLSTEELKEKHPLLGVPLTVKGSIEVAHMKITSGMLTRANITAKTDAVTVKYAREAGAIPILTSNIPELCMNWESGNKLKGTTKNPHNTTRTPGGSSGGEASLLASACSVIGIGSDVGGSLRLPAHFCGVWGHKPSPGVVSYIGHYPSCKNEEVWKAVFTLGPMARYATDLKLLLEVIVEPEMKDCLMLNEPVNLKDIRVFFMEDIESSLTTKVSDDCLEALHQVIDHFNTLCYNNCKKVKLPLMKHAPEIAALNLLDIDDVDNLFEGRGEGSYKELFKYATGRSESTLNVVLYGVLRRFVGYLPRSLFENIKGTLKDLKSDFVKLLGNDGVFIIPTSPMEACYHGDMVRKTLDASYLYIFNVLGLPVTNCPIRFTRDGLPIGVQVVAAPNCDRLTLAVAMEIEKAFGGWKPPTAVNSR